MPAEACVEPRPEPRQSRSVTEAPRVTSSQVTASPMTPAPTTHTSQSGIETLSSHAAHLLPGQDRSVSRGQSEAGWSASKCLFCAVFGRVWWVRGLLRESGEEQFPMDMTRATFGALAVFGIAAAGGGAYLANRNSDVAARTVVAVPAAVPGVVTETENAIAPAPTAVPPAAVAVEPAPAPAPVQPAKVARRAPVVERPQGVPERPRTTANGPAAPSTPAPTYAPPAAPETSVAA